MKQNKKCKEQKSMAHAQEKVQLIETVLEDRTYLDEDFRLF